MKTKLIIVLLLIPFSIFSQDFGFKIEDYEKKDIITLSKKGDGWCYLKKDTIKTNIGPEFSIYRNRVLKNIKDFPELYQLSKSNFHREFNYVKNVIKCYNNYIPSQKKPKPNADYFRQYNLISKKETRKGPTDEMLKIKHPIGLRISQMTTTTTHYDGSAGTYGEKYRSKFTYGNSPLYKSGFLVKNIKKAIGDDKEALKHIRKYRANWIARTSINVLGVAMLGLSLKVANGDKPFGLSEDVTPLVAIPTVFVFNWPIIFKQKYKSKNIKNAINTYNKNLK